MIRYRLWVWVLCLVFPTWVWAENETRTCTSFTQQGRQVTFHLADSAALQLQLCSSSVVKIWFSPDGQLQRRNASFAVINEELEEVGTIHMIINTQKGYPRAILLPTPTTVNSARPMLSNRKKVLCI